MECASVEEDKSFETGREIGEFAKGLLGDYEEVQYNENENVMIEKTEELHQEKPNKIAEATFRHDNNYCRADILKNDSNGAEIYEVKSSTTFTDIYIDDVAYLICFIKP